jgi:hypothetical protein
MFLFFVFYINEQLILQQSFIVNYFNHFLVRGKNSGNLYIIYIYDKNLKQICLLYRDICFAE